MALSPKLAVNKKAALVLLIISLMAPGILKIQPGKAAPKTITVPDDYPSIAVAIRNANDGDMIFVKKGTYEEKTWEINKPLSLVGEGVEYTQINLDPPRYTSPPNVINQTWSWFGPAITVESNDFRLEGFTITTTVPSNKAGGGLFITGNKTHVTGNNIATPLSVNGSYWNIAGNTFLEDINVAGSYSNITENKFSGTIWASGSYLNISANNKASSNKVGTLDSGIRLEGSFCLVYGNNVTVEWLAPGIGVSGDGNIVARNFVDRSKVGINIGGSNNIICANRITNSLSGYSFPGPNPIVGIGLVASGSNTFYANYVANNEWGAKINQFPTSNLTSTLYHNNFIGNTHQVATDNSYNVYGNDSFDNGKEGNYWSDYTGADANGDGIGDTPYIIDNNRQDRYPLMAPFDIESVTLDLSDWASPPSVHLISPKNTTHAPADVALEFTVNKQTSWMGYSLDGEANVTITGNTTLPKLSYGSHNITVYATDMVGRNGASETIYFTIEEPFPTTLVAAFVIIVCVFGFGLILNLAKAKRKGNNRQSIQISPSRVRLV